MKAWRRANCRSKSPTKREENKSSKCRYKILLRVQDPKETLVLFYVATETQVNRFGRSNNSLIGGVNYLCCTMWHGKTHYCLTYMSTAKFRNVVYTIWNIGDLYSALTWFLSRGTQIQSTFLCCFLKTSLNVALRSASVSYKCTSHFSRACYTLRQSSSFI
jgi:hypothetical protein